MIEQIDHLSYSSINTWLMCPRSWRFHYLDQIETPTSSALIFGSAFHEVLEEHVKTAFSSGRMPIAKRWAYHWQARLDQNEGRGIDWGNDTPESLNNQGVKMFSDPDIETLVDSLKPLVIEEQPQIEKYVTLTVPGVPVPLVGYIDMIESDGVPCDFKTSARSWSQSQAENEMQPVFYLAALNQAGHDGNSDLAFRHYVFVKNKVPKIQIWETARTVQDLFWLFGLISDVWKGIDRGVFPPNPGTWKCSPKYCEYWGICRGGE
jgi:hypothetical protein